MFTFTRTIDSYKAGLTVKTIAFGYLCALNIAPNASASIDDFRNLVLAQDFQSARSYSFCLTEPLKKAAQELAPKVAAKKNPDSFFNPPYQITKDELPQTLREMAVVQVLTLGGIIEAKPEFFAIRAGQDCQDFLVSIKPEKDIKFWDSEFIAIDRKFSAGAEITTIEKVSPSESDFKKIASKVYKTLTSKLSSKDRAALKSLPMIGGSPRIKADHVKFLPVKANKSRVWLVWLDGPWKDELSSKYGHTFSGAALLDGSGALISVIEPLRLGGGEFSRSWGLEAVTDLNGDGRQEILARHQGYEDGKIILHALTDDKKVESITLKQWSDIGE